MTVSESRYFSGEGVEALTDEYIAAAKALGPLIAEHKQALAAGPDLPAPIAQALERTGLSRLWLPRALGGPELPLLNYFRVIEAVARVDGTVGWCAAIGSTGTRVAGLIPESAAARLLGDGGHVSGHLAPTGIAIREGDAWRVSGKWSWGSFIHHSAVTVGICVEQVDGVTLTTPEGAPLLRAVLVPTADVEIIRNWNASGLRASGSHDFAMHGLLVPDDQTFSMTDFVVQPHQPGALYALPLVAVFGLGLTACSLGIARASIDAFAVLAAQKCDTGTRTFLREVPRIQMIVAQAETLLRSARALLFEAAGEFWQAQVTDKQTTMEQRALVRLASINAAHVSKQVVELMFSAAGGSAVQEHLPFATQMRDAQAAAQHLTFSMRNMEIAGRVMLGLAPGSTRF